MAHKKHAHPPNRPKKRGLARAGASLVIRGIARCMKTDRRKHPKPSAAQTGRRPTKAKSSGRAPSVRRVVKNQRELVKLASSQRSGEMVLFDARVVKTLPDDIDGDQHQRFIVAIDRMPSPIQTVLIAHNIDLAPRVPIERGSVARFYGQYEWNERGGLLHWTHHDPSDWREGGWIELHGKRYD